MGRIGRLAALAVALVLTGTGIAYAAAGNAAPAVRFTSTLVALHSEKCLQATSAPGHAAQQRPCTAGATQRVAFVPAAGGTFRLQARTASGVTGCLEARRGATADGTPVVLATCRDVAYQRFALTAVAGYADAWTVTLASTRQCLDVKAASQDDRAPVVAWTCGAPATTGNQVWRIATGGAASPTASATPVPTSAPTSAPTVAPSAATPSAAPSSGAPASPSASATATATSSPQPVPTSTTTPASDDPDPRAGTSPTWGKSGPPADAQLSRAYKLILTPNTKGYSPKDGECSIEVHARYWTYGPDGLVYPTWHPAKDPSGCTFGHEHGDDPRTSVLFAKTGWPPFGYTNQLLAPSDPTSQRDEDHVGHKVAVGNAVEVHQGGTPENNGNPNAPVTMTCDSLMKFHQGTHSPDALTNNLHELVYDVRCKYADDGSVIETRFSALVPIGTPGGFTAQQACSGEQNKEHEHVGDAVPANSPSGLVGRFIPDSDCAKGVLAGSQDIFTMNEVWVAGVIGTSFSPRLTLQIVPFFFVANPSRYFDADSSTKIQRQIDLCYDGAPGFLCDQVRRVTAKDGTKITFDDPRSPFNGAHRIFGPGVFAVQNSGPTTWYTDVFAKRFSTTPFPGAIRQYISGNHAGGKDQGEISGPFTDYAATASDHVHAPN